MPSQGFCFLWKKFQGSEWDFLPVSSHPLQTPYNDLAPNSLAACTTSRDFLWSTLCPSLSSEAHGKELASECSSLLKGSPEFPDSHTSTSWSLTVFCLFFLFLDISYLFLLWPVPCFSLLCSGTSETVPVFRLSLEWLIPLDFWLVLGWLKESDNFVIYTFCFIACWAACFFIKSQSRMPYN